MKTQIQTNIRSLSALLENLRDGLIQAPPFQREFVWKRKQIQELFNSIINGYPIGSILIWRPREPQTWAQNREIGGFILPNSKEPKSYVLDGYQRLSSLFGCLTNPRTAGLDFDPKKRSELFNLYLDLAKKEFIYPNGKPQPCQVPVCNLLSTRDFRQYSRSVLEPAVADADLLDSYLDTADTFISIIGEYKLAVIEVDGADINDAVTIFSLINSKGTTISPNWKINALSFSNDFDFSKEVNGVIEKLKDYNFDKISRDTIFRCYQSAFDDNLYIDTDIDTLAKHPEFKDGVRKMSDGIVKAVDFLFKELNVIDHKLLPYTAQLVFLSVFFMKEPHPSYRQIEDLKRWFWVTTYSNYFTANPLSGQRKAFTHFLDYINGWEEEPLYDENPYKQMKAQPWPEKFSLSSARCAALALFQLMWIKSQFASLPDKRKLVIKRIFKELDSYPANMIVTFSDASTRHALPFFGHDFASKVSPDDRNGMLTYRHLRLENEERLFVEKLGFSYE